MRDHREIGDATYHLNEHGATIRTAISFSQRLDAKGRCCGRKPIVYKRPDTRFFCGRCNREYDAAGKQRQNWAFKAWKSSPGGVLEFIEERPTPPSTNVSCVPVEAIETEEDGQ